ncbi:hypothetical protein [Nannocystis pusilla]|uniref:hypothetical protein n=1 Tax=Nannocystis pusilla TaxID=889268 RepID=UPI003B823B5B
MSRVTSLSRLSLTAGAALALTACLEHPIKKVLYDKSSRRKRTSPSRSTRTSTSCSSSTTPGRWPTSRRCSPRTSPRSSTCSRRRT